MSDLLKTLSPGHCVSSIICSLMLCLYCMFRLSCQGKKKIMDLSKYYTDQVYVNADKCLGPVDSHAKVAHVQMGVSENTGKKAHYSYLFLWDPMASCLLLHIHCSLGAQIAQTYAIPVEQPKFFANMP